MERQKTKIDWFNFFDNFYPTGFWLSFEKASTEARVTERSRDLKIDSRHTMMRIFKNRFRDDVLLFRNMTRHAVCQSVLWGPLGINLEINRIIKSLEFFPYLLCRLSRWWYRVWNFFTGRCEVPHIRQTMRGWFLLYNAGLHLGAISLFWNSHGF